MTSGRSTTTVAELAVSGMHCGSCAGPHRGGPGRAGRGACPPRSTWSRPGPSSTTTRRSSASTICAATIAGAGYSATPVGLRAGPAHGSPLPTEAPPSRRAGGAAPRPPPSSSSAACTAAPAPPGSTVARPPPRRGQRLGQPGHHPGLRLLRPGARSSTEELCRAVDRRRLHAPPPVGRPGRRHDRRDSGPLGTAGRHLVAAGPRRPGGGARRARDRHRRLDRADPRRRRRVRRWMAVPPGRRPPAPPRRDQHGHADRARDPGRPGGQRRRGRRPRGPAPPPRGQRGVRRPAPRRDGPAHRGHPGHRAGHRGPGPRPGRRGHALPAVPAAADGPGGDDHRRRGGRAGRPRERPGRRPGPGPARRGGPARRDGGVRVGRRSTNRC